MKSLLFVVFLLLFAVSLCFAQPKVACVYSKYGNYVCRNDQSQILSELGWSEDRFENIHIKDLVIKLANYDMVILNGLYNFENVQDLATYGPDFRRYIANGGCLLVTDANYDQQTNWLTSIDPGLTWVQSSKVSTTERQEVPWADTSHPLTANVSRPYSSWTYPSIISPYLTVIYRNADGSPAVGVLEIGRGVAVISGPYRHVGWPVAGFLKNLLNWTKDSKRATRIATRENDAQKRLTNLPTLNVPMLSKEPVIDGKVDAGEWDGAATISNFYDEHGRCDVIQPTVCKVARTKDDLFLQFECFENSIDKLAKDVTIRDGQTWENDSVEIFLDPVGKRQSYFQFTVGCSGAQYDGIGWDGTWDSYWEAKTSIDRKSWIAEIKIPLQVFGKDAFSASGTWTANFNRCAHPTYVKELTGWSPVGGVLHQPLKFGTLTGMEVKTDSIPPASKLQVTTPLQWYAGKNEVDVTLTKPSAKLPDSILQLLDLSSNSVITATDIPAKSKSVIKDKYTINLDTAGQHAYQFILKDTVTNRVSACSKVMKAETAPVLTADVIFPIVRGSIQSKDKIKKLAIDCLVGYDSPNKLQLVLTGVDSNGKAVSTIRKNVKSRDSITIVANAAKLPYGKYQFTLRLLDGTRAVYTQDIPLTVAPPAKTEVSFDDKHICYVNGKPFFPIGLYHVSPIITNLINQKSRANGVPEVELFPAIKELKERGFNAITYGWGMPDEKFLDYTQSLGMWVIPEDGVPPEEHVALANKYNNVLMWYGQDEPSGEALERIKLERARTASLDPNRPVSAAICKNDLFRQGLAGFDFIMMDPYLIGNAPLSGIATWIKKGFAASNGQKPVWVVPQAFTIDNPMWREPTPEELKCQAYVCLVNGATGFVWYAYWSPEAWSDSPAKRGVWVLSDTKLWDAFPKLNAEVEKLAPIILTGKKIGPAKCSSEDIQTCLWKYKGKSYLLTVNTLYTHVKAKLYGIGNESDVIFEDRKATPNNGVLEETYKPLEVHIYKW